MAFLFELKSALFESLLSRLIKNIAHLFNAGCNDINVFFRYYVERYSIKLCPLAGINYRLLLSIETAVSRSPSLLAKEYISLRTPLLMFKPLNIEEGDFDFSPFIVMKKSIV